MRRVIPTLLAAICLTACTAHTTMQSDPVAPQSLSATPVTEDSQSQPEVLSPSAGQSNRPSPQTPPAWMKDPEPCDAGSGSNDNPKEPYPAKKVDVRGVPTFISEKAGPQYYNHIPHCYSLSTEGAVFAAVNDATWLAQGPNIPEVTQNRAVQDENTALVASTPGPTKGTAVNGVVVHGFYVEDWGPTTKFVVLLVEFKDVPQGWLTWPMKMQFSEGDWRFNYPPADGDWGMGGSPAGKIPDGFLEWDNE